MMACLLSHLSLPSASFLSDIFVQMFFKFCTTIGICYAISVTEHGEIFMLHVSSVLYWLIDI